MKNVCWYSYEDEVTTELENLIEVTRSDAQGIIEANQSMVRFGFDNNHAPKRPAQEIAKRVNPEPIDEDEAHENYLLSEDYESDCKTEQWDWLKNESC